MARYLLRGVIALAIVSCLAVAAFVIEHRRRNPPAHGAAEPTQPAGHTQAAKTSVRLSRQARENLGLVVDPVSLTTWWRTIEIPGLVTDRPGISDRGVAAPVTGVVTKIHAYPGDTVEPGAPLFSLRLVSPSLHASQLELFKATREIEIARQQRQRLESLAQSGAVPQTRMLEIENQIQRMDVNVQAYRQDLAARGLPPQDIESAAQGKFLTEIEVHAPGEQLLPAAPAPLDSAGLPFSFELQQLKVELGQQVEAGQVLCYLADHRHLLIEGRGFKEDMARIQQAARLELPVEVDYGLGESQGWPPPPRELSIDHVANTMDAESRTIAFFLPLANQWQAYTREGKTRLVWRFRPGHRVRLRVAVEKLTDVFVLPQAAVVREGPEAYVFRQNGDYFDRLSVHVVAEDRQDVVIDNDGSLRPGFYVARNGAAALNRVLKSQSASPTPAGVHVHPDGTVHAAH